MMNMLACRLAKAKGKGDQMFDGEKYNKAMLKKVSGYVMQVWLSLFTMRGSGYSYIIGAGRSPLP